MKKLRKIFSLVFIFALMIGLSACEKEQLEITLTVKDGQGNYISNKETYVIDNDSVDAKISTPTMADSYILIKKTDESGQVIDEEVIKINEEADYKIKNLPKNEMIKYNFYTALTIDGDNVKVSEENNSPSYSFTLKNSPEEFQAMKEEQAQKEAEQSEAAAQADRESYAVGLFTLYVERNSNVKLKAFRGSFNVASHELGDRTAYIVTYKDKENPRIKLIFSWDGDTSKDLEEANFDPWYYLENGDEKFNELDEKRGEALNNQ